MLARVLVLLREWAMLAGISDQSLLSLMSIWLVSQGQPPGFDIG